MLTKAATVAASRSDLPLAAEEDEQPQQKMSRTVSAHLRFKLTTAELKLM